MLNETHVTLLNRRNVDFELEFSGATPKKEDILKSISTALKTKEELIAIKSMHKRYGMNKVGITAHVYDKVEDLKLLERINKKVKKESQAPVKKQEEKKNAKEEKKE